MEDRELEIRVLLVILLSLLFLIIYQSFFTPSPQQHQPQELEKEEKITKNIPEKMPFEEGEEEGLIVENENVILSISKGDGSLLSVKLKNYRETVDKNSPYVELVHTPTPPHPLSLFIFPDGATKPLYVKCSLKENIDGKFIFESENDRLHITKVYSYPSGYTLTLTISFKNTSTKPYTFEAEILWPFLHPAHSSRIYTEAIKIYAKDKVFEEKKFKNTKEWKGAEWIAHDMKYFLASLINLSPTSLTARTFPLMEKSVMSYRTPTISLPPGGEDTITFLLFLGPKDEGILKGTRRDLEKTIYLGWFKFLSVPLLAFLRFFYTLIHNYGVAILILTLFIKILFFPLTRTQYRAMKKMKDIQPLIEAAKKRYKDDKEKLQREILNIYRSYKVNPLSGCLPLLIQFPVFIALYQTLMYAIELRHAPFVLWINDLSSPDTIGTLRFAGMSISIHILPLLLGITSYLQQKLTPHMETGGDSESFQKWFAKIMPIFLTFIFWSFPSGLVLYWTAHNLFSIFEQIAIRIIARKQ